MAGTEQGYLRINKLCIELKSKLSLLSSDLSDPWGQNKLDPQARKKLEDEIKSGLDELLRYSYEDQKINDALKILFGRFQEEMVNLIKQEEEILSSNKISNDVFYHLKIYRETIRKHEGELSLGGAIPNFIISPLSGAISSLQYYFAKEIDAVEARKRLLEIERDLIKEIK